MGIKEGVPWGTFWAVLVICLALTAAASTCAVAMWYRHTQLRRTMRSHRPSFIPGASSLRSPRLREHMDVSDSPSHDGTQHTQQTLPPQMMGTTVGSQNSSSNPLGSVDL